MQTSPFIFYISHLGIKIKIWGSLITVLLLGCLMDLAITMSQLVFHIKLSSVDQALLSSGLDNMAELHVVMARHVYLVPWVFHLRSASWSAVFFLMWLFGLWELAIQYPSTSCHFPTWNSHKCSNWSPLHIANHIKRLSLIVSPIRGTLIFEQRTSFFMLSFLVFPLNRLIFSFQLQSSCAYVAS